MFSKHNQGQPYSYKDSHIAGPMNHPGSDPKVQYRQVMSRRERAVLATIITASSLIGFVFLAWLGTTGHAGLNVTGTARVLSWAGFILILIVELIRLLQGATLWLFASNAKDPIPLVPVGGDRVAVLTTIVPGKEPLDVMTRTLEAMKRIQYPGTVDVWILDEGDDDEVKSIAARLGVRHFSRKGKPQYNQAAGSFKAKTKAGNHNAWRAEHEHEYDFVAQMDTDHVPHPNFLMRTIGYFRDSDVAFVVAPQVYGNLFDSRLTKATAAQSYIFHGVVQRGGNGLNAPLLIGTNHIYRTSAWGQIGGYQDSIIEDHLTSLRVHGSNNPATGRRWKGVYTPDILAIGEGPTSWTDYFNQQKRWAYGIWDIVMKHSGRMLRPLTTGQKAAYIGLQFFYPSLAVMWLIGNVVTALYLVLGITSLNLNAGVWGVLWGASMASQLGLFLWLRRFNLAKHERKQLSLDAMGLTLLTLPVYAAAAISALLRRPLGYAVTAKGALAARDTLVTYRLHLLWIVTLLALIAGSLANHTAAGNQFKWALFTLAVTTLPVATHSLGWARRVKLTLPRLLALDLTDLATMRVRDLVR
jgi:cellulose synthase (UDP-forming)